MRKESFIGDCLCHTNSKSVEESIKRMKGINENRSWKGASNDEMVYEKVSTGTWDLDDILFHGIGRNGRPNDQRKLYADGG